MQKCTVQIDRFILTHLSTREDAWSAFDTSLDPHTFYLQISSSQCPSKRISASSLPNPSMALVLLNRSRPNDFVPMSLGFTSVLMAHVVSSFRKTKILNELESRVYVFHLPACTPVSLPLLVPCCCLLLRVPRMIVPTSFMMASTKINSAERCCMNMVFLSCAHLEIDGYGSSVRAQGTHRAPCLRGLTESML